MINKSAEPEAYQQASGSAFFRLLPLSTFAFWAVRVYLTGALHFPNDEAAKIAINTVEEYKQKTGSKIKVIFNVFKETDLHIYRNLLRQY